MSASSVKYKTTLDKSVFEVDSRYQPTKIVGSGAYGVVCAALDKKLDRNVAIKKIAKVRLTSIMLAKPVYLSGVSQISVTNFETHGSLRTSQQAFDIITIAKRTLLEIKLLRHFYKHDNIIAIETILQPPTPPNPFDDVYVCCVRFFFMSTIRWYIVEEPIWLLLLFSFFLFEWRHTSIAPCNAHQYFFWGSVTSSWSCSRRICTMLSIRHKNCHKNMCGSSCKYGCSFASIFLCNQTLLREDARSVVAW